MLNPFRKKSRVGAVAVGAKGGNDLDQNQEKKSGRSFFGICGTGNTDQEKNRDNKVPSKKPSSKKKSGPTSHFHFYNFEIQEFITINNKIPNYLDLDEEDARDLGVRDIRNDFWIQTNCIYMTDCNQVPGILLLKRNTIQFISKMGLSQD